MVNAQVMASAWWEGLFVIVNSSCLPLTSKAVAQLLSAVLFAISCAVCYQWCCLLSGKVICLYS
jgi:hypothetical protein